MPKTYFNSSDICSLPTPKKGVVDYTDKSKKYPSLILRISPRKRVFYYKVHTATPTLKVGFHYIADVTDRLKLDDMVFPEWENFRRKVRASKKLRKGFSIVTMRDYLDEQYRTDCLDSNKDISEENIKKIKVYFSHCLDKACIDLNDEHYKEYIKYWPKHSESTRRKVYYSLNSMLNILVINERIPLNPIKKRKFKNKLKATINTHDIKYDELYLDIFDTKFGKRTKYSRGFSLASKLIFTLFVDTGARPSEVRLLKLSDICLTSGKETLDFKADTVKTLKPRKVPIHSDKIIEHLKGYLNSDYYITNQNDYLFFNKATNKEFASGCWRALYREVKSLFKLKGRYYDFRHTFASKVYKHTGDIKLVADLIGDDVSTANRYYAGDIIDTARDKLKDMK